MTRAHLACGVLLIAAAAVHGAGQERSDVLDLPVVFEPNRGQARPDAMFVARGRGYRLEVWEHGTRMTLSGDSPRVLRMDLQGASSRVEMHTLEPQSGHSNYLLGSDSRRHITGVPQARKVMARKVYPGVDLLYYGREGHLEYDFIVAPGADPATIALRFSGPETIEIDANGDLVLRWRDGEVRHRKPVLYQPPGRELVDGRYTLGRDGVVRFAIGKFDRRKTLVIDPVLVFSSYLGGTGHDVATSVAVDANGDIYLTGSTTSAESNQITVVVP